MSRPRYSVLITSAFASVFLLMCSFTPGEPNSTSADTIEPPLVVQHPVLVELFTSQGCSSCPPADRVLQTLNEEASQGELPVITLSYHVDYWNRLGWRDPYSQATFSDRQRNYAQHLNDRGVYTPQAVVNGRSGHIGSRERELRNAVLEASRNASQVTIEAEAVRSAAGTLAINYQLSNVPEDALLQLAVVEGAVANEVPRGENRGRHLTHTNVVRMLSSVEDIKTSGQTTITLGKELTAISAEDLHLVLFVQRKDNMRVLGLQQVALQ